MTFVSCFQISNPRVTTFEIFDPGVAGCGNTVLQSGTQSHSSRIFIQSHRNFQSPRENTSTLFARLLRIFSSKFGFLYTNNFPGTMQQFSDQSLFYLPKLLPSAPLSCAGLSRKDQAKPISCEYRKDQGKPISCEYSKPDANGGRPLFNF